MIETNRVALWSRLQQLGDDLVEVDRGALADAVSSMEAASDEPLRLAVVGRVKAGKSTLVNALIGRAVAPTDDAECTNIVTWYRFGTPDRAELHLLDGTIVPVFGEGDQLLPAVLPVGLDRISHAVAYVSERSLRDYTLIDTPGLATTTAANEAATRRATLQTTLADALIYVFRDLDYADDVAFLHEFAEASGARGASAIDSLGVLTHADEFASGPWGDEDPLERAAASASDIAARRRAELGSVVPIAGRLAETTSIGGITERDARLLVSLADLDVDDLRLGENLPAGCSVAQWKSLSRSLGGYGIRHGRESAASGATTLGAWARDAGGVDRLVEELRSRYVGRHSQLRAQQVLQRLDVASDRSSQRPMLQGLIREARLDPALQPLAELAAWQSLRATLPDDSLLDELNRLIDATDDRAALGLRPQAGVAEVRSAAVEHAREAQRLAVTAASVAGANAAQTMSRSYRALAGRWTS